MYDNFEKEGLKEEAALLTYLIVVKPRLRFDFVTKLCLPLNTNLSVRFQFVYGSMSRISILITVSILILVKKYVVTFTIFHILCSKKSKGSIYII